MYSLSATGEFGSKLMRSLLIDPDGVSVLLWYDILITLDKEVENMWKRRRLSPATILWFLVRSIFVLFHVGHCAHQQKNRYVPALGFIYFIFGKDFL